MPGVASVAGAAPGRATRQAGSCAIPCNAGHPCDDANPCTIDTCDDASTLCVFSAFTGDAPITDPDPLDCKKPFCALGTLTEAPNDAEIPDDNKPCTTDACVGGQPAHTPVTMGLTPAGCDAPQKCDGAGTCVNCTSPSECGAVTECSDPTCVVGACGPGYHPMGEVVATQTLHDCTVRVCTGNTATAVPQADPTDPEIDASPCTTDTCTGTTPTHTITPGASCMGTKFCSAGGACVDCFVSANCAVGNNCQGGVCYSCSNNTLDPGETQIDCGNATCGACRGAICTLASQCASANCADGFCCNSACGTACQACSNVLTGKPNGTCDDVTPGTDPAMECAGALVCCGASTCGAVGCP